MLCLFDNFEQVVGAAPELAALLAACPIQTSSSRAGAATDPRRADLPRAAARRADGVALFSARARAVDPAFVPRRLSRRALPAARPLPLALELAAARTATLQPRAAARAPVAASRSTQGRPQRRSPPADPAGDNRVVVRPPGRGAAGSSPACPSSRADARSRPQRRSPAPIPTPSSRSSTRASCASVRGAEPRYWMLETIREYAATAEVWRVDELRKRHAEGSCPR